jgi:hypothetical protein
MTDKSLSVQIKEKPKICAIDVDQEIVEALQARGLHCFSGTLGSQVKVPKSGRHNTHQCLLNFNFPPNLHEYDIVLVDLQAKKPIEYIESEHTHSLSKGSEQTVLLSSYPETIFDPRPLSSSILRRRLVDFFKKETLVIVFCSEEEVSEYHPITINRHGSHKSPPLQHSLYEFMSGLQKRHNKMGQNVVISTNRIRGLKPFLQKYSVGFSYEIIFEHPEEWSEDQRKFIERGDFIPLLLNSDNEVVGFATSFGSSIVFAFPQLNDNKKNFLIEFIDELLPELFPKIFPYSEQFSWLKSENYFLPNQANLLVKKAKQEDEYRRALAEIEEEIQENQIKYQFLHDLISETGDSLVKSAEHFFVWLGFKDVVNMDKTNPEIKEEDLQILLDEGLLVIEIKGIGGSSKDSECSQISKIKSRRERERKSFDVFALYLVNHQRYLPPAERKNPPFSEHQITDAQSDERGLLTTYEVFKLYSNIENGFVTKEDARSCLLNYGLVQFRPSKARLIGCPLEIHHNGKVVILNIDNLSIHKGASIIVCSDEAWFRAEILEIQLSGEKVESVSEGEVGVKINCSVLKTSELWLEDKTFNVS